MKEGWTYKKLGEVCETTSGGTPLKTHKEYYEGGTIPWLRSGEIAQGSIYNTELYITELGLNNSSAKILPINTVVIAMYGATVGQVGTLKNEMATNQAICGILPNSYFNPQFLMYFLKSKRPKFLMEAAGGAQANISQAIIKNTNIPIIPLSTQQSIVSELDKINELIALKKSLLKDLDALAQSIFYEMFGDPVINEKGWEVKRLCEISSVISNGNTPKGGNKVYVDNGYLFLRSQNVWKNRIDLDDVAYIDDATHKKLMKSILMHNDLLITKTGRFNTENSSLGRIALFEGENGSANINGHVYLVRLKPGMVHKFVLYILISDSYRDLIRKTCVGGIDKRQLNKDHIEDFPIFFPPKELQIDFVKRVESIERVKQQVQTAIKDLETLLASRMDYWFND